MTTPPPIQGQSAPQRSLAPDADALRAAAEAPVLLVACDFDGTLSPIAPSPSLARAERRTVDALHALTRLPRTRCAVVSGRSIQELRAMLDPPGHLHLVGSHGAESAFWTSTPDAQQYELISALRAEAERIAGQHPGAAAEHKPFGSAVHVRGCDATTAQRAVRAVLEGPARLAGVHPLEGHAVVELAVLPHDKGGAISNLRHRLGASCIVFIGDDATDEHAFRALSPTDISVRIGDAPTAARFRMESQDGVGPLLEAILEARAAALAHDPAVPITAHAMLSDQRTVALIDDRGELCWMCLPRADSGAVFASLLGERGGRFRIGPRAGPGELPPRGKQSYFPGTMIATTRWAGVTITDYLDCSGGRAYQRTGRSDLLRVVEGTGECEVRFEPAPDFGRGQVTLTPCDAGLMIDTGTDTAVLLSPGVAWEVHRTAQGDAASATFTPGPSPTIFELRWGQAGTTPSPLTETQRRTQTQRFWSGWASSLTPPPLATDAVVRSALAIKALCHGPSGAILAAATTSLPEHLGGMRNWDYRFCWPRDSCFAALALTRLGNTGVAMKLLDWLVEVVATAPSPDRLRPIYTVTGDNLWPEAEITALSGYHASRPVRIGNAADGQVQLDVFGPIVDLVAALGERGTPVTPEHWRLVQAMVEAVELRWREPDHGIWEFRGPRHRHVHSAVMCWLAATRGAHIARDMVGRPRPNWESLAEEIKADILTHGVDQASGAFTLAYDSPHPDAAALWVVLSGMLAPDDPRAVATVRTVESALRKGPIVYRYRFDDGMPGDEGGFVIASFWLAEALWMIGDRSTALELFHQACALAGPTGLLAEQHDPDADTPLGNYPQAYSHLGLINAAVRLSGL